MNQVGAAPPWRGGAHPRELAADQNHRHVPRRTIALAYRDAGRGWQVVAAPVAPSTRHEPEQDFARVEYRHDPPVGAVEYVSDPATLDLQRHPTATSGHHTGEECLAAPTDSARDPSLKPTPQPHSRRRRH